MKKVLLGLFGFTLLLSALFYQEIRATIAFYQYQSDHQATFAQATITWDQIPVTSSESSSRASDALTFDRLTIPVPYGATKHSGADAAMAVGNLELITITHSSAAADFFRMYNFSDEERNATCTFLSTTSGRGACTSSYEFFRAFLALNQSDIHVFSSLKHKALYNRLLEIRAEAIPANTIAAFETSNVRGFLYTTQHNQYQIDLFNSQDQQYHLELSGLSESDVAFVLSNITQ